MCVYYCRTYYNYFLFLQEQLKDIIISCVQVFSSFLKRHEHLFYENRDRRHFGARGRSSVRYGTRLGDLKENWFLLFSN